MTADDLCLLRVPVRAAGLLETLRDQGIETRAEFAPALIEIRSRDLVRVLQTLEEIGISYVVESKASE